MSLPRSVLQEGQETCRRRLRMALVAEISRIEHSNQTFRRLSFYTRLATSGISDRTAVRLLVLFGGTRGLFVVRALLCEQDRCSCSLMVQEGCSLFVLLDGTRGLFVLLDGTRGLFVVRAP